MMNSRTTNHKTGANECIIIRVKDHTGGEMMFKIKKSVMMSKVFSAYAQRKGLDQASLHFMLGPYCHFRVGASFHPTMNDPSQVEG